MEKLKQDIRALWEEIADDVHSVASEMGEIVNDEAIFEVVSDQAHFRLATFKRMHDESPYDAEMLVIQALQLDCSPIAKKPS